MITNHKKLLMFQKSKKFPCGKKIECNKTSKLELKKNVIKKKVFEREIALCRRLSKENRGKCGWGKCQDCGVIPLLYKLYKGKLLEDPAEIKKLKRKFLNKRCSF
jgi:hypothetical protein